MSGPLLDIPMTTQAYERIEPVRREVPGRRITTGPPRAAVIAAVLGALLAAAVGIGVSAPLDTTWAITAGSVRTSQGVLVTGDEIPFGIELIVVDETTTLDSGIGRLSMIPGTVATLGRPVAGSVGNLKLATGDVLVDTEVGRYTIDATVSVLVGDGVFRVVRSRTPRLAVYSGNAAATSGLFGSLGPFTQMALDGGSGDVRPIALSPTDPWDVLHAAVPLDTDAQIEQLRAGLEATYGTSPQLPAFYGDFVGVPPELEAALAELAPTVRGELFGPPAESLVAAAVLETLRLGQGLPMEQVIGQVLPDRAGGGSWGVLMAQRDLDAADLRAVADDALRRRAELGDEAVPVIDPPTVQPRQPAQPQPEPTTPATVPDEPDTPDTPEPEPPTEPPTEEPTEPPGPLEDPIGTITDLLTPDGGGPLGLDIGGLLEPGLVGGVVADVADVVGGVTDLVGDILGLMAGRPRFAV